MLLHQRIQLQLSVRSVPFRSVPVRSFVPFLSGFFNEKNQNDTTTIPIRARWEHGRTDKKKSRKSKRARETARERDSVKGGGVMIKFQQIQYIRYGRRFCRCGCLQACYPICMKSMYLPERCRNKKPSARFAHAANPQRTSSAKKKNHERIEPRAHP